MAYGNGLPELYRLVGLYVGRILKGENQPNCLSSSPQVSSGNQSQDHQSRDLNIPLWMQMQVDEVIE